MGGGVVTGLILQGSLSLYACYMSNKLFQDIYNLILEKICSSKILTLHLGHEEHNTDQKTTFSAEMQSPSKNAFFFVQQAGKGKTIYILYTMVLIPAMQFTLYCCRYCHICLQYNIYIYT